MKILIIDDDKDILEHLSYNFRKKDINVSTSSNVKEAWLKLEKDIPDLILTDIRLPHMSGIKFCRILKSNLLYKHIPIIFLSATNDDVLMLAALEAGGVDFLTKPLHFNLIYQAILDHLEALVPYKTSI